MISQVSLISLLAASAVAQTTVQSIFFAAPSNNDAFVGSVVGVTSGLTTYAIACTSGSDSCATGTTVSITEGPSSFNLQTLTVAGGQTASVSEECKIQGRTSATCIAAVSASAGGVSTAVTTTRTLGEGDFNYHPVTITAGAGKLAAATGSAGASGSGNAGASGSGNAAAPMVTGMGWAAGAAVVGLAAVL